MTQEGEIKIEMEQESEATCNSLLSIENDHAHHLDLKDLIDNFTQRKPGKYRYDVSEHLFLCIWT